MSNLFPDDQQPERTDEQIPADDLAALEPELAPDTQGNDPLDAELGADGQGDLTDEDDPIAGGDDGPTDLRISDEPGGEVL